MEEYQHRFIGPYRAAFPEPDPQPERGSGPPWMLALPGNHDWYDGLTAFTRTFHQGRRIGGWQTTQSRSYFAVSLPGRWWLWAIDIQFDSYIDVVQHRWLQQMSERLRPGDGVILCTAKPAWTSVHAHPEDYRTIDFVERTFVEPRGAEIRMILSGDKHHYSRYEAADGRHLVTAGGGGAYLTATHHLPDSARVPPPESRDRRAGEPVEFTRRCAYPEARTSAGLGRGVFRLPALTPGLASLVGGLHALVALALLWTLGAGAPRLADRLRALGEGTRALGWGETVRLLDDSVTNLLLVGLVLLATWGLTKTLRGWFIGIPHGAVQVLVALSTTWLGAGVAAAVVDEDGGGWSGVGALVIVIAVVVLIGAPLGAELVALSLLVGDRWGINSNELFAAQAISDYKNFLRIHVSADGRLTVCPIGLEKAPRAWRTRARGSGEGPRIEPEGPMQPHLIEAPFGATLPARDR